MTLLNAIDFFIASLPWAEVHRPGGAHDGPACVLLIPNSAPPLLHFFLDRRIKIG